MQRDKPAIFSIDFSFKQRISTNFLDLFLDAPSRRLSVVAEYLNVILNSGFSCFFCCTERQMGFSTGFQL